MSTGDYTQMVVSQDLQNKAFSNKSPFKESLGPLLHEVISNAHGPPAFCKDFNTTKLISEHKERVKEPTYKPKVMVLMAGIGCDALAAIASWYDIALLVEVCPHACELLDKRFPDAKVLWGNIRDSEIQSKILDFKDIIDAVLFGIPCQPSSDADPHPKPDDDRLQLVAITMKVAMSVNPRLLIAENVAAFKKNRKKHFNNVLTTFKGQGFTTQWIISNAKHLGVGTQRRRIFIFGFKLLDTDIIPVMRNIALSHVCQEIAYKHGLKTSPDIHETLSLFDGMRGIDGIFLHQRRPMGTDVGNPARIVSTRNGKGKFNGRMPTITSKARQSQKQFANYEPTEKDEALKDRTLNPLHKHLAVLNGLAYDTEFSSAMKCAISCDGCTSKDGKSRGRVRDRQLGNIVIPAQFAFSLRKIVRALSRACMHDQSAKIARESHGQHSAHTAKSLSKPLVPHCSHCLKPFIKQTVQWHDSAICFKCLQDVKKCLQDEKPLKQTVQWLPKISKVHKGGERMHHKTGTIGSTSKRIAKKKSILGSYRSERVAMPVNLKEYTSIRKQATLRGVKLSQMALRDPLIKSKHTHIRSRLHHPNRTKLLGAWILSHLRYIRQGRPTRPHFKRIATAKAKLAESQSNLADAKDRMAKAKRKFQLLNPTPNSLTKSAVPTNDQLDSNINGAEDIGKFTKIDSQSKGRGESSENNTFLHKHTKGCKCRTCRFKRVAKMTQSVVLKSIMAKVDLSTLSRTLARSTIKTLKASGKLKNLTLNQFHSLIDTAVTKEILRRINRTEPGIEQKLVGLLSASSATTKGITNAIVDSGASSHFCTKDTVLTNIRSAKGAQVTVANGRHEGVEHVGDKDKLKDIKMVSSFDRSLISVSKLTQLVGLIAFDAQHVYAVSFVGARMGKSIIGDLNQDQLYNFDLQKLNKHCEDFKELLPENGGMDNWDFTPTGLLVNCVIDNPDNGKTLSVIAHEGTIAVASAVSDQEAAKVLQLFHQQWGHPTTKQIKKLHDQGVNLGADLSTQQIIGTQFYCEHCMKSKYTKKPYHKKSHHKARPNVKCGQYLVADIVTRTIPSISYIDGTGKRRGHYRHALYVMCETSGRIFIAFLQKKSDLRPQLQRLIAHIEIEMVKSCDYDGNPPKVLRITSDRESTITSTETTVDYLEARIEQRLTATHGTNQTPRLDSAIRQTLTHMCNNLQTCGLGLEFWEFAFKHAGHLQNHTPNSGNILGRSPQHRWTGTPPDMSNITWKVFGCDCHVHLRIPQREHGDKASPRCAGGDGSLRYLGPDIGLGTNSMGDIIFDMKTKRVSIERDVKFEQHMDIVRKLGTPGHTRSDLNLSPHLDDQVNDPHETKSPEPDADPEPIVEALPPDKPPQADTWTRKYTTTKAHVTLRQIAKLFNLELPQLQTRNRINDVIIPAHHWLTKGTELWLPGLEPDENGDVPIQLTHDEDDKGTDLVGRTFKHRVGPYGMHTGLVLEGPIQNGKHARKYKVLYDDMDVKFLKSNTFIKSLLPLGRGNIDMQDAVDWWEKERGRLEDQKYSAETNYKLHANHVREQREKGTQIDLGKPLDVTNDTDGNLPYWLEANRAFTKAKHHFNKIHGMAFSVVRRYGRKGFTKQRLESHRPIAEKAYNIGMGIFNDHLQSKYGDRAFLVKELAHLRCASVPVPKRFKDAINSDFAEYWRAAIQQEIDNLKNHGTFKWVPPPKNERVNLDSSWVFKAKSNNEGQISRFKARLVARGFRQRYGHDYAQTMAL